MNDQTTDTRSRDPAPRRRSSARDLPPGSVAAARRARARAGRAGRRSAHGPRVAHLDRRTTFGLLGIAAVLAVGGALAVGSGGLLPIRHRRRASRSRSSPRRLPTAVILSYAVQWTSETPSDAATLARLVAVLQQRVAASGAVGVIVQPLGDDRIA